MWGQSAIPTLWPLSTLYMGTLNAIPAWQFKDANCMWWQSAINTLWPLSTLYMDEGNLIHA
jgi:hypothetical protein